MTFCGDDQNKNEIIEQVKRVNNEYIIYYLDGTKAEPYNSDTEYLNKLEEKMIKQAVEREFNINNLNNIKIKSLILNVLSIILTIKSIEKAQIIPLLIGLITLVLSSLNFLDTNSKLKEIKKYRILLDNYKEFKENPSISKIIEFESTYCDPLDIMSVDRYSLKDVKNMYKELKKIKDNQEY